MECPQYYTNDIDENSTVYDKIGDRTSDSHDYLKLNPYTVQVGAKATRDGKTRNENLSTEKPKSSLKKRLCIGIIIAVITVLVVVVAVMIYLLLSSETQGGSCEPHTDIRNGKIIRTTGSRHGDILEIQCDKNSKINGPNPITCLSSSMWSAEVDCVPKDCGAFVLAEHMTTESDTSLTTVGKTILVACKEGFTLSGNNSVFCQADELWSESPTCEPVDCGYPKHINNSKELTLAKTTFNSKFTVDCINGYSLIGPETVICNKNGLWDDLPVCEIVSCGIPNIPAHASITNLTGTTFQSNVSLKCDEGYSMQGSSIISCTSTGNWTTYPTCKAPAITTATERSQPTSSTSQSPSTTIGSMTTSDVIPTTVINGHTVLAIYGQDMIKYIRVNQTRVVRGADWGWSDQDSNGPGTVVGWTQDRLEVYVLWDNGKRYNYRMGLLGLYDLYLVSI